MRLSRHTHRNVRSQPKYGQIINYGLRILIVSLFSLCRFEYLALLTNWLVFLQNFYKKQPYVSVKRIFDVTPQNFQEKLKTMMSLNLQRKLGKNRSPPELHLCQQTGFLDSAFTKKTCGVRSLLFIHLWCLESVCNPVVLPPTSVFIVLFCPFLSICIVQAVCVCTRDEHGSGPDQDWSQFWPDHDWIGLRKFVALMWLF